MSNTTDSNHQHPGDRPGRVRWVVETYTNLATGTSTSTVTKHTVPDGDDNSYRPVTDASATRHDRRDES